MKKGAASRYSYQVSRNIGSRHLSSSTFLHPLSSSEAQDEIESRKDTLIAEGEACLRQKAEERELFTIAWAVE